MNTLKYWWWAIRHADKAIEWHKEWRIDYDYFWYDGPHRSIQIGPVSFYINA